MNATKLRRYRVVVRVATGTNEFTMYAEDINDLYSRLEQIRGIGPARTVESATEVTS